MDLEKKNIEDLTYTECPEVINRLQKKKEDVILHMARLLEKLNRYNKIEIKDKIIKDLQNLTSADYIRRVLGPEYTDQRFNPKRLVAVSNTGQQTSQPESKPKMTTADYRAEYERNKYAKMVGGAKIGDVPSVQLTTVVVKGKQIQEIAEMLKQQPDRLYLDFDENMHVTDVRASL